MVTARKLASDDAEGPSVFDEIEGIRRRHKGLLRPDDIVTYAETHPESALHSRFEWDDSAAAIQHRLWQARELVQQFWVVSPMERKPVRMYISVPSDRKVERGGYRSSEDVLNTPELREQWRALAIDELVRWSTRYGALTELDAVHKAITKTTAPYLPPDEAG